MTSGACLSFPSSTQAGSAAWHAAEPDVIALVAGRHGDPFAVLGPHRTPAGVALRAFVPGAEEVEALLPGQRSPVKLQLRHEAGFFEAKLPGNPPDPGYRLRARNAQATWEFIDPYAFEPILGPLDDHLLVEGTHRSLYERLGAHVLTHQGVEGVHFAVWAPNAAVVSVVADFNFWDGRRNPMRKRIDSGLWEIFIPSLGEGSAYKFRILSRDGVEMPLKADPFGFSAELRPATASVVARTDHFTWTDDAYLQARHRLDPRRAPISAYEVHLGSWRRGPDGRFLTWDELADTLVPYAADLGFTHLELLPITEHPLDASWGYQPVGMFAVTRRFGPPEGFARFVDRAHAAGLGVILDWVPAHFPTDEHGLGWFDGSPLYEHADPRRGRHEEWGTAIFDYGRREVSAYLIASALYWLDRFHVDGLRVDAVASMLYLDYSRRPGEWLPNPDGSNDNKDAVAFLQRMNAAVYGAHPGAFTAAEESTAWAGVTLPTDVGGLGFGLKWNMGWMHDTLDYMSLEPVHRAWHHDRITFGLLYAHSENFVLPLSHDEVVHGKRSILGRMPGDDWQRFANLRSLYAMMWSYPGKKLLFMGQEFGQWREWDHAGQLDWNLLDYPFHVGVQKLIRDLNRHYRAVAALHARDCEGEGFRWLVVDDNTQSVFAWARLAPNAPPLVCIANLTPVPRSGYRVGLPLPGRWREVLNTDATDYGGSGVGNLGFVEAEEQSAHGMPASAELTLPPLATLWIVPDPD
ncbi:1,4-alpha-glucan branching enzyme [Rhodovastum atsumiense]|uniref:1,4-alpha-glucan branching enzyme GlgB n=1 Tax=Rhodovastum atsumiense TaxID=504468 RepID=A0A5M6IVS1_9PROT|nr:1,4-alpha-glucan branching protein GlgB [Rhodovastum atsumiense]KAA5612424.1 1,4-alpha-glucan branching protein GlgB [Rhodovastum atsumiense]CAH2600331.1 1,4-alpha-glucan branching enzyme [Rhodovastum atsumiense]